MLKSMLACCKVYISESRNKTALDAIERAVKRYPDAVLVNKFEDETYNRVGYTLVSKLPPEPVVDKCALRGAVFEMVRSAFDNIDFQSHCGSHPRLGVVDHICFHPLAYAQMDDVACVAKLLAADVGSSFQGFIYSNVSCFIIRFDIACHIVMVVYIACLQFLLSCTEERIAKAEHWTRSEDS